VVIGFVGFVVALSFQVQGLIAVSTVAHAVFALLPPKGSAPASRYSRCNLVVHRFSRAV